MTPRLRLIVAFVVGGASGLFAGCQTYDFELVRPLAIAQRTEPVEIAGWLAKPNLTLNGKVEFQGALCTQLATATASDPVNVEFRVVQTL